MTILDAAIWVALVATAIVIYTKIQHKNGEPVGIARIKKDIEDTRTAMKLMDETYGAFIDSLYDKHEEKKSAN